MHLIIPFASALSEAGQHALTTFSLPNLERLLRQLTPTDRDEGDESSLSPPHERALARLWGWQGADGTLPWAAHAAALDGVDVGHAAWGLLTPVHWRISAQGVLLVDPEALALGEAESRALLETLRPAFESEGYTVAYGAPLRWYASQASLDGLPCASLDRVIGRDVDLWLAADPRLRKIRRLQSEAQMMLYENPTNDAREARGALAVNSFWLSGCGVHQPVPAGMEWQVDDRLRQPVMTGDWAAWVEAWQALDAGPIAEALQAGRPMQLTLCGERHAQRYETRPRKLWARLTQAFDSAPLVPQLQGL